MFSSCFFQVVSFKSQILQHFSPISWRLSFTPPKQSGGINMYAGSNQRYNYIESKPCNRVISIVINDKDHGNLLVSTLIASRASSRSLIYLCNSVLVWTGINWNKFWKFTSLSMRSTFIGFTSPLFKDNCDVLITSKKPPHFLFWTSC